MATKTQIIIQKLNSTLNGESLTDLVVSDQKPTPGGKSWRQIFNTKLPFLLPTAILGFVAATFQTLSQFYLLFQYPFTLSKLALIIFSLWVAFSLGLAGKMFNTSDWWRNFGIGMFLSMPIFWMSISFGGNRQQIEDGMLYDHAKNNLIVLNELYGKDNLKQLNNDFVLNPKSKAEFNKNKSLYIHVSEAIVDMDDIQSFFNKASKSNIDFPFIKKYNIVRIKDYESIINVEQKQLSELSKQLK